MNIIIRTRDAIKKTKTSRINEWNSWFVSEKSIVLFDTFTRVLHQNETTNDTERAYDALTINHVKYREYLVKNVYSRMENSKLFQINMIHVHWRDK